MDFIMDFVIFQIIVFEGEKMTITVGCHKMSL